MDERRNDLLIRAARRQRTERTPVWLMRQAGRTDPQYVALRRKSGLPLETLFRNVDLCAEISLLPERFGVDAIIFFQDILTPLAPMGARFIFRPGPVLDSPIRTTADIEALCSFDPACELDFVRRTLQRIKKTLDGRLPLIGFAGAPWTLAAFLIEGKSPRDGMKNTKALIHDDPAALHHLLDKLADMTADYLALQIEAGADVVQLFDSFADELSPDEYERFAHPYHVKVFSKLAATVPTILFAHEQPRVDLMAATGADVLSVGTCVDLADAKRRFGHRVAFQGNVNHRLLVSANDRAIDAAVEHCIRNGAHEGHILNLNQGLSKETPFRSVRRFVQAARSTVVAPGPKTSTAP